jgi:hypothetical protein
LCYSAFYLCDKISALKKEIFILTQEFSFCFGTGGKANHDLRRYDAIEVFISWYPGKRERDTHTQRERETERWREREGRPKG